VLGGPIIRRVGRDAYRYSLDGRCATIHVEMLSEHPGRVIYVRNVGYWDPPNSSIEVSREEEERIAKDFKTYFDSLGMSYEIA